MNRYLATFTLLIFAWKAYSADVDNKNNVVDSHCVERELLNAIERFENEGGATVRNSQSPGTIHIRWAERVDTTRSRVIAGPTGPLARFDSNLQRFASLIESDQADTIIIPARWGRGKTQLGRDLSAWWNKRGAGNRASNHYCTSSSFSVYELFLEFSDRITPPINEQLIEQWSSTVPWVDGLRAGVRYLQTRGINPLFIVDEFHYPEPYASEVLNAFASAEGARFVVLRPRSTTASVAADFRHFQQVASARGANTRLAARALEPESLESVRLFLNRIVQGTSVQFSEDAVDAIFTGSGGWPYEINAILLELPENVPIINRSHVLEAIRAAQAHSTSFPYEFNLTGSH